MDFNNQPNNDTKVVQCQNKKELLYEFIELSPELQKIGLSNGQKRVLLSILSLGIVSHDNVVLLTQGNKENIRKDVGMKIESIKVMISQLCSFGLLLREKRGDSSRYEYVLNSNTFKDIAHNNNGTLHYSFTHTFDFSKNKLTVFKESIREQSEILKLSIEEKKESIKQLELELQLLKKRADNDS